MVWNLKDYTKKNNLLTSELTGYSNSLLIFDELSKEYISEKGRINKKPLSRGGYFSQYKKFNDSLKEVESLYKRDKD